MPFIGWSSDEMIVCEIRTPPSNSFALAVLPFEIWWERLSDLVIAYQAARRTYEASKALFDPLTVQEVRFDPVVDEWSDVANTMRTRETLEGQIAGQRPLVDIDFAQQEELRQELVALANLRLYRSMNQPQLKLFLEDDFAYVTVQANGAVIVTPLNQTPPEPN